MVSARENIDKEEKKKKNVHFQDDLSPIHINLLAIRVFDGGIITLDPNILDKLSRETAFADTAYVRKQNVRLYRKG